MIARTDWTVSSLAVELGLDRRTLARRLSGLEPVTSATTGKRTERHYRLADVLAHLAGGDDLDLNRERAVLTKLQQQKLELELAELRAELVRVPTIETHWQAMVAAMRAELLAVPGRAAPKLAGLQDHATLVETLRDEICSALAHIAGDAFPDDVRRRIESRERN